jgi:plasmid stabilization system protein ParE
MSIEFHPAVQQDVAEARRHYHSVSETLADEFEAELRDVIALAAANPGRFHLVKPQVHRANLKRFPYHVIYRRISVGIRITLVRHNRRHPNVGMERR